MSKIPPFSMGPQPGGSRGSQSPAAAEVGTGSAVHITSGANPEGSPAPEPVLLTVYDDDPIEGTAQVDSLSRSHFSLDAKGNPIGLIGPSVRIVEDEQMDLGPVDLPSRYRQASQLPQSGDKAPNPWHALPPADADGNFVINEELPAYRPHFTESADGVLGEELRNDHVSQINAFYVANQVHDVAQRWSGQEVRWGVGGQLPVFPHSELSSSLSAWHRKDVNRLDLGVASYRDPTTDKPLVYEVGAATDIVAHEAGHAVMAALKPHLRGPLQKMLGESFGDQMAMWSSLMRAGRVDRLMEETGGDLASPNALNRLGGAGAALVGLMNGGWSGGARSATEAPDNLTGEPHFESQKLTATLYDAFLKIYDGLKEQGRDARSAAREAGDVMGTLLIRSLEFLPEDLLENGNQIIKAYLSADSEYFGSKHRTHLLAAFQGLLGKQERIEDLDKEQSTEQSLRPDLQLTGTHPTELATLVAKLQTPRNIFQPPIIDPRAQLVACTAERGDDGRTQVLLTFKVKTARGSEQIAYGRLGFDANGKLSSLVAPQVELLERMSSRAAQTPSGDSER